MRMSHNFEIAKPPGEVFNYLLDVERVAPCLPGARLTDRDGETYSGSIRVKVGPITTEYQGTATVGSIDDQQLTAEIMASGSEVGGQGGANAQVQLSVTASERGSAVQVDTDVDISGRAAQFGRGVMEDVAKAIIDQFADNLEASLTAPTDALAQDEVEEIPSSKRSEAIGTQASGGGPLDLLSSSWKPLVARLLPYVIAAVVGFVAGRVFRAPSRSPSAVTVVFGRPD